MTLSQLKIWLQEQVKTHERSINDVHWSEQKSQVNAAIRAYKKVIEMIDGPTIDDNTPDCNCFYSIGWHYCPFHGYCNPSTGVGV